MPLLWHSCAQHSGVEQLAVPQEGAGTDTPRRSLARSCATPWPISGMQRSEELGQQQPSWTHTSVAPGTQGKLPPSHWSKELGDRHLILGQGGEKKGFLSSCGCVFAQLLSNTNS